MHHMLKGMKKWVSTLMRRVDQLETNCPKINDNNTDEILEGDFVYREVGQIDERETREQTLHQCLHRNRHDMGGNKNNDAQHNTDNNYGNDDPYA